MGIVEKAAITTRFLVRKQREYTQLQKEILQLQEEVRQQKITLRSKITKILSALRYRLIKVFKDLNENNNISV